MSDFLRHLIRRHVSSPSIRPRAASRFELPAVDRAPAGGSTAPVDETSTDSSATGTRRTVAGRSRALGIVDANGAANDEPTGHAGRRGSDARDRRVQGLEPASLVDRFPGARSASASEGDEHAQPRPRPVSARHTENGTVEPTVNGVDRAQPGGTARRSAVVRPADPAPRTTPVMPRRAHPAGVPTTSEPDVVRIHIGRVEVRAIIAPPPERPRTTPTSDTPRALSLSSYLDAKRRP